MKKTLVRYKVKADRVAENQQCVVKVFQQLREARTAGLHYASFRLDDGVTFVHIVFRETDDARNPLNELSAFKAFTAGIAERCVEPPVVSELSEVGSYRFFGSEG
jgi:hypothetical protein